MIQHSYTVQQRLSFIFDEQERERKKKEIAEKVLAKMKQISYKEYKEKEDLKNKESVKKPEEENNKEEPEMKED